MKIVGKKSVAWILKYLIDLVLIINITVLLFLPRILKYLYGTTLSSQLFLEDKSFLLGFLYPAGILTAVILVFGHLILNTLAKEEELFSQKNVTYFRGAGIIFFILAVLFAVKIFLYPTILTIFCAGVFLVFGMVALVLSEVFKKAHAVWVEHELTI